jgi:hypothetical protein
MSGSGPDAEPRGLADLSPAQALWRGAVTALVVVLPVAVFNNLLVADGEDASSPLILLLFALIMLGGASGGWAVIRLSPAAGLPYAAGAAALAYVVAQALGVVLRLLRGDDLNWLGYPFAALLMATCGMLGGMFARRWQGSGGAPGGGN